MIELYISNLKVDLTEDVSIALTYKATDLDYPTASKNGFSKSIVLKGTPNNNKIFGEIWKMDRMIADGVVNVGISFDASKRIDASIFNNSELVDNGYVQLDKINLNDGDIQYELTYYSALGDFFYNLMYDDNEGEKRTLADLYYGFEYLDNDGNRHTYPLQRTMIDGKWVESEDDAVLFDWDMDYISEGWVKLKNQRDNSDKTPSNIIVAAPTYNGYYENFDNDKVLVNTHALSPVARQYFPKTDGAYGTVNGYALMTAPRELSEWEVKAFNSPNQRVAVKFDFILNAISNPINNGGYSVNWDEDIVNSDSNICKYYQNSYLLFDKFNLDNILEDSTFGMKLQNNPQIIGNNMAKVYLKDSNGKTEFDLSSMNNPSVMMSFQTQVNIEVSSLPSSSPDEIFTQWYTIGYSDYTKNDKTRMMYSTYNCYQLTAEYKEYNPTLGIEETRTFAISPVQANYSYNGTDAYNPERYDVEMQNIARERIKEKFGVNDNNVVFNRTEYKKASTSPQYITYADGQCDLTVKLPSKTKVKIYMNYCQVSINLVLYGLYWKEISPTYSFMNNGKLATYVNPICIPTVANGENVVNSIYNGNPSPDVQKISITKKVLFGDKETPYDYLIGFAKLFGLKFLVDKKHKTVNIMQRSKYYQIDGNVEIVDFSKNIDYSKAIEINPTLSTSKWLKYGLYTPNSYAQYLYSKNGGKEFGNKYFNTKYNFNNETSDLYDGVIYNNYVPYLLSSIYFNRIDDIPTPVLAKTYEYTLFNANGEEKTEVKYGYSAYNLIPTEADTFPKICCFDKDNSSLSDLNNALVLFDGMYQLKDEEQYFCVYDNMKDMKKINGNFCHLYSESPFNEQGTHICNFHSSIPRFEKYKSENGNIVISYDFVKPDENALQKFIGTDAKYSDDKSLMQNFWFPYSSDLYSNNTKSVSLYVTKIENPQLALRRFYFFENSIWMLNEIVDYTPNSDKATKCVFVKVQNIDNYTTGYNQRIFIKGQTKIISDDKR